MINYTLIRQSVIISTAKWNSFSCVNYEDTFEQVENTLDKAGALGSDIALLPEFTSYYSNATCNDVAEEIPHGVMCKLLWQSWRNNLL